MINEIGASAVRSLSVDIANLSARLAVQTAVLENLLQVAGTVDPGTWKAIESNGDDTSIMGLPLEQSQAVEALLFAITSVQ